MSAYEFSAAAKLYLRKGDALGLRLHTAALQLPPLDPQAATTPWYADIQLLLGWTSLPEELLQPCSE
jgi:hypothetical protein